MKGLLLKHSTKKNLFVIGMLLIPTVHLIVFWFVVNFNSILMAFQRTNRNTGLQEFTWDHFAVIRNHWQFGGLNTALINTLMTAGLLALILPWGFFVTYFLYKRIRLSGFWRLMFLMPTIIPAVAMASIFTFLVYPEGPVGSLWTFFGAEIAPFFLTSTQYAQGTILFYIFWTNFGGQFILFSGAMSRIPKEVLESAHIDGAGMWTEMIKIVLPLCWPTISMLLLLNISSLLTASGPVLFLTAGEYNTATISYRIFANVYFSGNLNQSAALGLVCTLILFPIVVLSRWLLGKVYANVEF